MKKASFNTLTATYRNREKPTLSLANCAAQLPIGSSPCEILTNLMNSRRLCCLFLQFTSLNLFRRIGSLPSSVPSSFARKTFLICVVIVDELYHESIWRRWLEDGDSACEYQAELLIHAKYPDAPGYSPWVKKRILDKSFFPEWNSTEVVRAMLELLNYGLLVQEEVHYERFIFATESCIPVVSVKTAGNMLFSSKEMSWTNVYNVPKNSWEDRNCFKPVNREIIPPQVFLYA
jgi:hypothetical protein